MQHTLHFFCERGWQARRYGHQYKFFPVIKTPVDFSTSCAQTDLSPHYRVPNAPCLLEGWQPGLRQPAAEQEKVFAMVPVSQVKAYKSLMQPLKQEMPQWVRLMYFSLTSKRTTSLVNCTSIWRYFIIQSRKPAGWNYHSCNIKWRGQFPKVYPRTAVSSLIVKVMELRVTSTEVE